jgi:hypothetical protein
LSIYKWDDSPAAYYIIEGTDHLIPQWGEFNSTDTHQSTTATEAVKKGRNVFDFEVFGSIKMVPDPDEPDTDNAINVNGATVTFSANGVSDASDETSGGGVYVVSPPDPNTDFEVTVTHPHLPERTVTISVGESDKEENIYLKLPQGGSSGLSVSGGLSLG